MIKPIQAIAFILLGNVYLDNKKIPVVKQSYPYDKTPCITIDDSGGSATISKKITNKKIKIPDNHPQTELHDSIVSQQVIREYKRCTININVWCDTEKERDSICNNILDLFYKAQSDHYMFCSNFNNGFCSTLESECLAIQDNTIRNVKNQCPSPLEYDYTNIFKRFDLDRKTFHVESPFSLDDLTGKKPVLRSIIRFNTNYYDYYVIGGGISQNLDFSEDLL